MKSLTLTTMTVLCCLVLLSADCTAQRGGRGGGGGGGGSGGRGGFGMQGGMRQGGGPGGGQMGRGTNQIPGQNMGGPGNGGPGNGARMSGGQQGNDCMQNGGSGSGFAGMFGNGMGQRGNQGTMNRGMGPASFGTSGNQAANQVTGVPTAQQFAQAAMSFDGNHDGQLSQQEMIQVATAVIAELRQRNGRASTARLGHGPAAANGGQQMQNSAAVNVTAQLQMAFVTRAMTFDSDHNGSLNTVETQAMAAALLAELRG